MIKLLLRICLIALVAVFRFSSLKAQNPVRVRCNTPTCEEPADPGLGSHMNNYLVITQNTKAKILHISLNYFQGPNAEVAVINSKNELVKTEKVIINQTTVELNFNLKRQPDGKYTVRVTSLDRIHFADVVLGTSDGKEELVKL